MLAVPATASTTHTGTSVQSVQQGKNCHGTVKDADGEMIIGATVLVKGTKNATVTGVDGNFSLNNVAKGAVLQISYLGYDPIEVTWKGGALNVVLAESETSLNEVVVTGYSGTIIRSKLTNSISKVKNENLTTGMFSNVAQALSGTVAGLRVIQSSGNPNSAPTLILRGGTDYNGSGSPLVVVDGMIRSSMADINPNDIETMEVMKDAGATAIYGSRANNGVILITTKQGKTGTSKINFNTKLSWNYFNNPYDFLDAGDYLYYMRRSYLYASQKGTANLNSLSGNQPYGTGNDYYTDGNKNSRGIWGVYARENLSDELYNKLMSEGWGTMTDPVTGKEIVYVNNKMEDYNIKSPSFSQDYNLSFSGGNERGHYYAGFGFNRSEGNAINNYNRRLSGLLNADYKIRPWLTSISNINVSSSKERDISPFSSEANYFSRNFSYPPTFRSHNADGELLLGKNSGDGNQQFLENAWWEDDNWQKFNFAQDFRISPIKGLDIDFKGNWYYEYSSDEYLFHTYLAGPGSYNTRHTSSSTATKQLTQTYNILVNYNKSFGLHNVSALVGWEYFHQKYNGLSASGYNPDNNYFADLQYTLTDEGARSIDSDHTKFITESYFARVNYDYDSKYLASFTLRRDGISKLSKDNRWGTFPGLSLGWVFSKEKFMKSTSSWLNFGKLRASWGKNGNVNSNWVGNYTVQGNYLQSTYNGQQGYYLNNIPNPYLTWETSRTYELGFDLAFLNNKIQTNFTWYNRRTFDKYASIIVPASSGWTSITSNNGTFQNSGIEFELNYHALNTKDWRIDMGLNLAMNTNKVIKLPANGNDKNRQGGYQVYTGNGDEKMWVGGYAEGERPGELWTFQAEGIYKSYDEIPGDLVDRSTSNSYYGGSNRTLYGPTAYADGGKNAGGLAIMPGDVKWKDVNGDGVIDNYDLVKQGNTTPKWTGGFNLSASWKGLTLSTRLDFALGFVQYDYRTPWIMGNAQGTYNTLTNVKDTWSEDNVDAKYPIYIWADQLNARNYTRLSSMFCYKGDYLSFREVTLSYNLPKLWLSPLHIEAAQLSVTGQNLGYICEAPSMASPEVSSTYGGYPLPRMLVLGLNVTF
jgi:TonB-linked SusC/RagA family outer membrane protein